MKENFPNLVKEMDFQEVQEAQRVPKKLDPGRNTRRYIIIKLSKIKGKERILKAAREKETVTYKGVPVRLSADFSKEILQARRGGKEIFEVTKSKEHPRLLYPAKLSFRMEGQIKCFPDKVKLKGPFYVNEVPNCAVLIGQAGLNPLIERLSQGFSAVVDSDGIDKQAIVLQA